MKKKLAFIAGACVVLILLGGLNTVVLYSTEYLSTKSGYTYSVSEYTSWWDCNWSYCKKIIIDHTKVQADQTNFPVLLYRASDAELAAYAQPDGDDIAFVDRYNITQYKHEIEKYVSGTGELVVWVNVTSVSSTEDTILYMYYGNPDCSNQQNVTATWDSDYALVQHLDENLGTIYDSTSNNNDGINNGATYNTSSKIDGGYDFNGSNYILCNTSNSLNVTTQITLEGWAKDPPLIKKEILTINKFEIKAIKAEHLNKNREIVSDIYNKIKTKDNIWSEPISNGEYARITFEQPLSNINDITIFARSNGIANVEVYTENSDILITKFERVSNKNWYKIHLSNLSGKYNKFDLRTIGSPVEYDYIVDPPPQTNIDTISPYNISSSPLIITATNTTPTDKVTLWYRYSIDNSTWWNSSFTHRKKITITGQAGTGLNYQVLLEIGETSGASGEDFDLGGLSSNFPSGKNKGGDLRFADKNNTNSLDFWVENVSGTTPNRVAKIWVEVKESLNSSKDIYCYYGNPSASNASNGTNTFIVFDDFDGPSLDTDIWTTYNIDSNSQSGSILTTSSTNKDPNKVIMDVNGAGPTGNNVALRTLMRATVGSHDDQRSGVSIKTTTGDGRGYNFLLHDYTNHDEGGKFLDDAVAWGTNHIVGWSENTWYTFEISHDGTNIRGRRDDGTWYTWARSGRSGYLALNNGGYQERSDCEWDWALARKCIATEPAFSSAGSKENWMQWNNVKNPDTSSPWSWTFNFPNGTGYYEVYSIGNKSGEVNESVPYIWDAKCYCGIIPVVSNPVPVDEAILIPVPPNYFNITINHSEGYNMNITWRTNTSGIWVTFNETTGGGAGVGNGTYSATNTSWVTSYITTYWWSVNVTDDGNWTNATYSFTTKAADSIKPSSNVSAVIPYWKGPDNNPLTIICTDAEDDPGGIGLKNVTLYYYNSTNNATWKGPWMFGVDIDPWVACSWSFTFPNGTGYHRFYSRAADNNTNIEDPPVTNDTDCGYDETNPASQVDSISPYEISVSPLTINATASDSITSVKNITLWYLYSDDNSSFSNWQYKKKITLSGQAGAGLNYQVLLEIGETSGASGEDFDLGGHSSSFPSGKNVGGDLRFADNDNITDLDFWVESVSGVTPNRLAKVWVEVRDTLNSSADIYCYYGNPSASNASNGKNTFIVFDDFQNASLDASIWTAYQVDSTSFSNGIMTTSTTNKDPSKLIATAGPTGNNYAIRTYFRATVGVNADQRMGVSIKTGLADGRGYNYLLHDFAGLDSIQWLDDHVAWGAVEENSWAKNTWYTFEICHDGTDIRARRDDGSWKTWTGSGRSGYLALNTGGYLENCQGEWDYAVIRKCIATEPAFSSAGSEAELPTSWLKWNDTYNPDTGSPWSWNFDFPNGTGYYQFISIANDTLGNQESLPASVDAICFYRWLPIVLTNTSTGVEETNATLQGYLEDGGVNCTVRFEYGTNTSYGTNTTNQTKNQGEEFSENISGLTPGQLYWYRAYAENIGGADVGNDIAFLTKPLPPTTFTAQVNNSATIYLTWAKGTGANLTYIEYNTSAAWARGKGTVIYNGSDTQYEHTGLTGGVTYYYQAWSYTNWTYNPTVHEWSDDDGNATTSNITNNAPAITLRYPSPNGTGDVEILPTCSIWANDSDGDALEVYWYENTTGSWVLKNTNASVSANSTVNYTFAQFNALATAYWWKIAVNDTIDNVTAVYHFMTAIETSVDTISPYEIISSSLTINATGPASLDNVTLWYRYSYDNFTWWNASWSNRKLVYFNVSSGQITANYTVLLNITHETDMNNNFSDLRFVRYANSTMQLDHWIENKSDGNWAKVWVELKDNITTTSQPLAWMYYGNPIASTTSNGTNTFPFFDDFPGASLNSRWIVDASSYSVSNSILRINVGAVGLQNALSFNLNDGYIVEGKILYNSLAGGYSGTLSGQSSRYTQGSNGGSDATNLYMRNSGNRNLHRWTGTGSAASYNCGNSDVFTSVDNVWYLLGAKFDSTGVVLWRNRTSQWSYGCGWIKNINYISLGYFAGAGTDIQDTSYDWVLIRKYQSTEPTYTIQSESSWMEWENASNPDDNNPWQWSFDFPNGTGYYQFYSIGKKAGFADEAPPPSADAICFYNQWINTPPTIEIISPANGTTVIELQPACSIWANDTDGQNLTVYWYENTSGSWILRNINSSVTANSTVSYSFAQFNNYSIVYYWKVAVNDSIDNTTAIYHFTTEPINTSVDTIIPFWITSSPLIINATAEHDNYDNVTLWYRFSKINFSWWNESWSYRKPIKLKVSSGSTPSNYQVLLNVTYRIDMKSDFSDLRFVNYSNNNTLYDYWIESKSDGKWCNVWVEIGTPITTTNKTLAWMYYGNPSASTASSGANTFVFFDDFNSFDAAKWTATGSYSVSSSNLTITTGSVYTDNTISSQSGLISEAKLKWNNFAGYSGLEIASTQTTYGSNNPARKLVYLMTNGGGSTSVTAWAGDGTVTSYNIVSGAAQFSATAGTTYILGHAVTSSNVIFYRNRAQTNSYGGTWSGTFYLWLGYFTGAGAGGTDISDIVADWVIVRKYSSSTPTYYIENEVWTKWNDASNPDTNSPWQWNFDFPNGTGYYQFYSIGKKTGSADELAPGKADAQCKFNNMPTISNEIPSNESIDVQYPPPMNITINDDNGDTMTVTWYSNSSGSWQVFGSNTSVGNGTYHQLNNNFSEHSTMYWWYVAVSDGVDTNTSAIYHFTTGSGPPNVTTNATTGVEETNATLWGYLVDDGGETCTVHFEYGTTQIYGTNTTNQTKNIGEEFSANILGLTPGKLYHYRAYANNSITSDTGNNMIFLTKPNSTTGLNAQSNDSNTIYLTWVKGIGANLTHIERNASGIKAWARGAGTLIYNGSDISFADTGLNENVTYYYQAWSYTNWTYDGTTLHQYSDQNASASNTTNSIPTVTLITPAPNGTTNVTLQPTCQIWANDTNGGTLDVYWYENTTGIYVLRQINNNVVANSTVSWTFIQATERKKTYYWRVAVNDSKDNTSKMFYFTTVLNAPPILSNENPTNGSTGVSLNPVLGIQINDTEGQQMNITWYWGEDASCPNFIGINTSITNGTYSMLNDDNFSQNLKLYYWRIVVNDGNGGWTNATYQFTTVSQNKFLISKNRDAYSLEMNQTGTKLYGYINTNIVVEAPIDTNWHYVTMTYDGNNLRLYKDGVLVNTTSWSGDINFNQEDVLLGQNLTGALDEIRISSTARNAAWINTTYQNTNSPTTFATFGNQIGILTTWIYRKQITINHSLVDDGLTNFPILISTTDTNLKDNAQNNGYDILFTTTAVNWETGSYTQKLNHEIEKYTSATGELVAWVNITQLSDTTDTNIYMYYGNNYCTANRQNPSGTWNGNYIGVWHLSETPTDGGTHYDSTSRDHDLTFHDTDGDSNTNINGIADGADELNGDADYMHRNHHSDFNLSNFTLECWVTLDDKTNTHFMINKELDNYTNRNFALYSKQGTGLPNLTVRTTGGANVSREGTTDLTTPGWHYIAGANSGAGTDVYLYVNGTLEGTWIMSADPPATQSAPLMIGRENSTTTPNCWDGKIDEIRISKIARNESWINTTYNTISSPTTFLTLGDQKTRNVAPTQTGPSPNNGATGSSLNPQLAITVNDANSDTMNVAFRTNATGAWANIGSNNSVNNGTYRQTPSDMDSYDTKYWWSVNLTDGTLWTNTTYSFTTYSFLTIRPNAVGKSTQLTAVGEAQNYLCVDEASENGDTDYVYSNDEATYINDTYNLTDHTTETGNINFIRIYLCGKENGSAGAGADNSMKPVIYTNDSYYDSDTAITLTDSFATSSWTHNVNPITSAAWTWGEIDDLEIGVGLIGEQRQYSNCTQVYVEVVYTPS